MSATQRQFLKYVVVGLASNGAGYIVYLLLTATVLGPKLAMSVTYVLGVLGTYLFNRRWTFRHQGDRGYSLIRYGTAYAFGYVINFSALAFLVDQLHLPHQIVQGCMVIVVAILLFLLQKYWVFRATSKHETSRIDKTSSIGDHP